MSTHLTIEDLEAAMWAVDPAVLLASPQVLRRVIRLDRRIGNWGLHVPHASSYLLPKYRLLSCVSRFELEIDAARFLPDVVLLIERPDDRVLEKRAAGAILRDCWRRLFHLRVHQELEQQISAGTLTDDNVLERLRAVGSPEYAEIRAALSHDELILPPRSDLATYVEFAAVFLELMYFASEQLAWYFPALTQTDRIAECLARDVSHAALYEATRVPGADEQATSALNGNDAFEPAEITPDATDPADPLRASPPAFWRLIARAERASTAGNVAKAAILRQKASRLAVPARIEEIRRLARAELERLVQRLAAAGALDDSGMAEWTEALTPLVTRADHGFRTIESRLLFDLQKVCLEHERGLFRFQVFRWCVSRGRQPLRQPQPLLSQVMAVKHLQSAVRKLAASRLTAAERAGLSSLLEAAVERAQQRLRERIQPLLVEAFNTEGLQPANVPEQVARDKIVEELLDRIIRQGYLSLGHLRDAISQNYLKLPDLASPWELLRGDVLLRLDRRLAAALPGVYARGPVYLRGSHRLSALGFGTRFGRGVTRYLAIPYGGALLLVEFVRHMAHRASHPANGLDVAVDSLGPAAVETTQRGGAGLPNWETLMCVFALGTFFLLLLTRPNFRQACLTALRTLGHGCRWVIYDWPLSFFRLPWVRRFFDSDVYRALTAYGTKPAIFTGFLVLPFHLFLGRLAWETWGAVFLAVNLALNSPLGRYVDQLLTEQLVRGWRELQIHVLGAVFHAVMDLFHYLLNGLERAVYTVDEWLRFRTGDSRWSVLLKFIGSIGWMFISYVTMFAFTLLIEPQINPIKHFPVVTVSHKLLLPTGPMIVSQLMPYIGAARANTLVWSTIWLIPGVFGFLVWELKENWRLYAANRPPRLRAASIGPHGEPLLRLLRLGFHSGTLPRLFGRLRQAGCRPSDTGAWQPVHRQLQGLQAIESAIRAFLERELIGLLAANRTTAELRLRVDRIQLEGHRVVAEIERHGAGGGTQSAPLQLSFQERAGWIIAALPQRGWLDAAPVGQQDAVYQALRGLYHAAGVHLVWEHVQARCGPDAVWYDFRVEGLWLWDSDRLADARLVRFRDVPPGDFDKRPARPSPVMSPELLDELFFSRDRLDWEAWVRLWDPAIRAEPPAAPWRWPQGE